jgi:DNA-binding NarL/FixJ family response regulator
MFVLIVDDHPLFREGLKALLQGLDPGVRIAAFASVADTLTGFPADAAPDLVLLDMTLPGTSRLEALAAMRTRFESAAVVVVSGDEDPALIRDAIEAGAAGYIPKTTDPMLTIQALRLVLANGTYMPRAALERQACHVAPGAAPQELPHFSERQLAVLKALLHGKPNKLIARELDIAEGTVKAHLWAVYQALHVSNRAQAMYRAHELGLFEPKST